RATRLSHARPSSAPRGRESSRPCCDPCSRRCLVEHAPRPFAPHCALRHLVGHLTEDRAVGVALLAMASAPKADPRIDTRIEPDLYAAEHLDVVRHAAATRPVEHLVDA